MKAFIWPLFYDVPFPFFPFGKNIAIFAGAPMKGDILKKILSEDSQ